jgi:hypothetical protein
MVFWLVLQRQVQLLMLNTWLLPGVEVVVELFLAMLTVVLEVVLEAF